MESPVTDDETQLGLRLFPGLIVSVTCEPAESQWLELAGRHVWNFDEKYRSIPAIVVGAPNDRMQVTVIMPDSTLYSIHKNWCMSLDSTVSRTHRSIP